MLSIREFQLIDFTVRNLILIVLVDMLRNDLYIFVFPDFFCLLDIDIVVSALTGVSFIISNRPGRLSFVAFRLTGYYTDAVFILLTNYYSFLKPEFSRNYFDES
jgi:hypothetical protein